MDSIPEEIQEFCREVDAFLEKFGSQDNPTFIRKLFNVLKKAATAEYIAGALAGSPLDMIKPALELLGDEAQGLYIISRAKQLGHKYPEEFSLWIDHINETGEIYCGHWKKK